MNRSCTYPNLSDYSQLDMHGTPFETICDSRHGTCRHQVHNHPFLKYLEKPSVYDSLESRVLYSSREGVFVFYLATARSASKSMRVCPLFFIFAFLFLVFPHSAKAQSNPVGPPRQVKISVQPMYSALAKRLNLNGVVRVEVQVAPDGKVKKAHVLGGHPVLAVDAEKAALLTEFEPGPKETTQVLEFRFGSSN
jgi:TonB family protein